MRVLIAAFALVVASLGFSGAAMAKDLMAVTYENTVVVEAPDGTVTKMYFNEDGTYTTSNGDSGTWAMNDEGQLCTTNAEGENCGPIEERQVGDSWETTAEDGSVTKISIVAGRE